MIEVEGLRKAYGDLVAVDDVSFVARLRDDADYRVSGTRGTSASLAFQLIAGQPGVADAGLTLASIKQLVDVGYDAFISARFDAAVDALTSLLEPMLMVGLGGSIGALLVAMYLPIFKIAETVV